jgi:hypothetical protein
LDAMLTRTARRRQMASSGYPRPRGTVLRSRPGSVRDSETASVMSDDSLSSAPAPSPLPLQGEAPDLSRYDTKSSPFVDLGNPFTTW